jgi:hypothetical protein
MTANQNKMVKNPVMTEPEFDPSDFDEIIKYTEDLKKSKIEQPLVVG